MREILCYGDSNTYGLSPEWVKGAPGRHGRDVRWPCRLEKELGEGYRVTEAGLNGRTTIFEDTMSPCRRGLDHIRVCVESHLPLDLVIIMLGTNDVKSVFNASPAEIAQGMGRLVQCVLDPYLYFPSEKAPKVLIAAPVPLGEAAAKLPDSIIDGTAIEKSGQLARFYKRTADMYGCEFIDLAPVASTTDYEGIHLDRDAHIAVARAMAEKVREIFGE